MSGIYCGHIQWYLQNERHLTPPGPVPSCPWLPHSQAHALLLHNFFSLGVTRNGYGTRLQQDNDSGIFRKEVKMVQGSHSCFHGIIYEGS